MTLMTQVQRPANGQTLNVWVAIKYFTTHISVKKSQSSSGLPSDMGMAEWIQRVKGQTGNI